MKFSTTMGLGLLLILAAACSGPAQESSDEAVAETAVVEATPDEKVAELEQMCAEAGPAMEARQAEKTLFERVGGREGIEALIVDVVARHQVNEPIKHLMEGVDADHLVMMVTDFLAAGTGGDVEYHGRTMVDMHKDMGLTNADFLAAGSDIGAAMDAAGWGEDEKQEMMCAFVGLRGEVVTR